MKYEIDENDYIIDCLFNCNNGVCVEYTGDIPTGYDSLEEWHEAQTSENKLNAWKIIDGNLVFDSIKYEELQELYEVQTEENSNATHSWVRSQLTDDEGVVIDEFTNEVIGNSLIALLGSGEYKIPKVTLNSETITGSVNVISSNKNHIEIDNVTTTESGITFTINGDGTITLDGTASDEIELTLKGTSTNTDMLFLILKDTDYTPSGLTTGVSINLYNYDGTNKTLVGNLTDETINLSTSYIITQTALHIDNGSTFNNETISPQFELGSIATAFIEHSENKVTCTMRNQKATIKTLTSYNSETVLMCDKEVDIVALYYTGKIIKELNAEINVKYNEIETIIQETTGEQNTKISELEQKVDGWEYKLNDSGVSNILYGTAFLNDSLLKWNNSFINEDGITKNSVGFIVEDNSISISGRSIKSLNSSLLESYVCSILTKIKGGTNYTFNYKYSKNETGTKTVYLYEFTKSYNSIDLRNATKKTVISEPYELPYNFNTLSSTKYIVVLIENLTTGSELEVFDIMLNAGENAYEWSQNREEFYNGQTSIDENGVTTKISENNYVNMDGTGFNHIYNGDDVFNTENGITTVEDLVYRKRFTQCGKFLTRELDDGIADFWIGGDE